MTDREMLEFAAKAIGGELSEGTARKRVGETWDQFEWIGPVGITTGLNWLPHPRVVIYPLEDDGDALRVAVKLKLLICTEDCMAMDHKYKGDRHTDWFGGHPENEHVSIDHDELDPFAATRRAIVRAAAEIGKAMW